MLSPLGRSACSWMLGFVLLFTAAPRPALADSPEATVTVGFDGRLKVGCWTPIRVTLSAPAANSASIVATTSDFEGNQLETPLSRESPTVYSGIIQVGRLDGSINIELRDGERREQVASVRVTPDGTANATGYRRNTEFWAVIGAKGEFAGAADSATADVRLYQGNTAPPAAVAIPLDWSALPSDPQAWDSLDVIIVGGNDLFCPPERDAALRRWTAAGGRLVLMLGSSAMRYKEGPLARWSPIELREIINVPSLDSVQRRVEQSIATGERTTPLRMGATRSVPVAVIAGPSEGSLRGPTIWSKPYGFGLVTASAVDFDQPPLSTWVDQTKFLRLLVNMTPVTEKRLTDESDPSSTGVTDLSSQLVSNLDRFENVHRPSFRVVLLWTMGWVLVLFPLDYLVVHRLLRRPHLTWLTLPVLIAVATVAGTRSATAANAAPLSLNQIDLLDYDPTLNAASATSWMTFYSGQTARYDVAAKSTLGGKAQLGWNAKAEEGLRGLYRQGGIDFGGPQFSTTADHTEFQHLPVRLWSSYSVESYWEKSDLEGPPLVESDLIESDSGRLRGTLTHHFPGEVKEWILAYKNFIYHPRQRRGSVAELIWAPGSPWTPHVDGESTLIRTYLTGLRQTMTMGAGKDAKLDQVSNSIDLYDPAARDPARLLRTISFHEAAGGPGYTGLTNHPLARQDLSRLVDFIHHKGLDRAILMGRLAKPVIEYEVNGAVQKPADSWTFFRVSLPVKITP